MVQPARNMAMNAFTSASVFCLLPVRCWSMRPYAEQMMNMSIPPKSVPIEKSISVFKVSKICDKLAINPNVFLYLCKLYKFIL